MVLVAGLRGGMYELMVDRRQDQPLEGALEAQVTCDLIRQRAQLPRLDTRMIRFVYTFG